MVSQTTTASSVELTELRNIEKGPDSPAFFSGFAYGFSGSVIARPGSVASVAGIGGGRPRSVIDRPFTRDTTTTAHTNLDYVTSTNHLVPFSSPPPPLPIITTAGVISTAHGRPLHIPKSRAVLIIAVLTGVSFLNTMGSGILTVSLPRMAADVSLPESLLLWPASVYALAAGSSLLIFGSVGDVVGPKIVWALGATFYSAFTFAVGLANSGAQLIAFRTVLGIAIAMCLPTAVSLTTNGFGPGRWRNMAFAFQGMGQPLGYSVGLILGGVFTDTIGWRYGFYISAGINAALVVCALFVLPSPPHPAIGGGGGSSTLLGSLLRDIDWVGAVLISASLGLLSYVFSAVSRDYRSVAAPHNVALLVAAALLVPAFVVWVGRQERLGRPALIPNSLWRNAAFSSTCAAVFFTWAVFNAFQYFSALYFERVEGFGALGTSLRFLPMVFVGAGTNIVTGFLVEKVEVRHLVSYSAAISAASPLLMALVTPSWDYWKGAFFAMLLSPLHPDVLFTVSNLIISKAYPGKSQSLAGAVFNAVSQVGNSVGLGVTAAVSSSVTQSRVVTADANVDVDSLLAGYHASFWLMFASAALVVPITMFGLRRGGKVGASD